MKFELHLREDEREHKKLLMMQKVHWSQYNMNMNAPNAIGVALRLVDEIAKFYIGTTGDPNILEYCRICSGKSNDSRYLFV